MIQFIEDSLYAFGLGLIGTFILICIGMWESRKDWRKKK